MKFNQLHCDAYIIRTELHLNKTHCMTWRNCSTMLSTVGLNGYGNTGREASQVWRAMGGRWFGVWVVRGSNPGGTHLFVGVSFKWYMLESSWSVINCGSWVVMFFCFDWFLFLNLTVLYDDIMNHDTLNSGFILHCTYCTQLQSLSSK